MRVCGYGYVCVSVDVVNTIFIANNLDKDFISFLLGCPY